MIVGSVIGKMIIKEVVQEAGKEIAKKSIKETLNRDLEKDCTPLFLKKPEIGKALLGSFENPFRLPRCLNRNLAGNGLFKEKIFQIHGRWVTGVFPEFKGIKINLSESVQHYWDKYGQKNSGFYRGTMQEGTLRLREMLKESPDLRTQFTKEQLEDIEAGKTKIRGKIWHHYEELDGKNPIMQLVDEKEHNLHKHTGGSYTWNEKHFVKCYGADWEKALSMQSMEKSFSQIEKNQQCKVLKIYSNKASRVDSNGRHIEGTYEHSITAKVSFPNGGIQEVLLNEQISRVHTDWLRITANRVDIIKQEIQGKAINVRYDANEKGYKMTGFVEKKTSFLPKEDAEFKTIFKEKELVSRCKELLNQQEQKGNITKLDMGTLTEKEKLTFDIYSEIKKVLPINAKLKFEPLKAKMLGEYDPVSNTITLNKNHLPYMPAERRLDTLLHESRHAYQRYAVNNPHNVDISPDILKEWRDNMRNYCSPKFDIKAYYNQPLEVDARVFAEKIVYA